MAEPGRIPPVDPLEARALYDGQRCLGWLVRHTAGWLAYDARERLVGVFRTRLEATEAVARRKRD